MTLIICAVVYLVVVIFAWALCRAGAEADRMAERMAERK